MSNRQLSQIETTLANWLAWAKMNKKPEEIYYTGNARNCALGQFTETHGLPMELYLYGDLSDVFFTKPHTFGDAMSRAEEKLRAKSV